MYFINYSKSLENIIHKTTMSVIFQHFHQIMSFILSNRFMTSLSTLCLPMHFSCVDFYPSNYGTEFYWLNFRRHNLITSVTFIYPSPQSQCLLYEYFVFFLLRELRKFKAFFQLIKCSICF